MNKFNEKEFIDICRKFNMEPHAEEITIRYSGNSFYNKMRNSVKRDRRGEVAFCVIRPSGKIIAITCKEYPVGVYRIPTGGIGHGEDIVNAVFREIMEELGLDVVITGFAGVLKIRFEYKNEFIMFYSYVFILGETGGRLLLDASDDEISEVREVDIDELREIVDFLDCIPGKWSDWGKFRYESSKAVLNYLTQRAGKNSTFNV